MFWQYFTTLKYMHPLEAGEKHSYIIHWFKKIAALFDKDKCRWYWKESFKIFKSQLPNAALEKCPHVPSNIRQRKRACNTWTARKYTDQPTHVIMWCQQKPKMKSCRHFHFLRVCIPSSMENSIHQRHGKITITTNIQ